MNNCFHIFTHKDLDGITSLLIFKWYHDNDTICYKPVTNLNIEAQVQEYLDNTINESKILLFDLALRESFKNFDFPFITFYDHHKKSNDLKNQFKKAKVIHKEFTSNSKFMYKYFHKIYNKDLTEKQKKLIEIVDDFDSGSNKLECSKDLNIIFWALYRNNINKFLKKYEDGFVDFNEKEKLLINKIKIEAIKKLNNLPIFQTNLNIENQIKKVICSHSEDSNLLTLDYIMKKYDADLVFFINTYTKKVSLKQKKSENMIDLGAFAKKYCEGDGHDLSAGGKITDIFMEITKNFKQIL